MNGQHHVTAAELAAAMRCDLLRVEALVAEGMPALAGGKFDLYAVAQWLEETGRGRRCNWRGVVKTQQEVADAFGVHRDTVRKFWRAAGMPGTSGKWDLAEIAEWRRSRDTPAVQAVSTSEFLEKRRAAQARIAEGKARQIERENRLAEEEICYRGDVERFLSQLFEFLRELHSRLPAEMRPQIPAEFADELCADLEARHSQIQRTLHGWVRRIDEIAEK